jgi:glyoxylase-like metal-dependent hydrolase (beta-lactamase superfamily II)
MADRLTFGSVECHVLADGTNLYHVSDIAPQLTPEELRAAHLGELDDRAGVTYTAHAGEPEDHAGIWMQYSGLLLRAGGRTILVDSGAGAEMSARIGARAGRLSESLAATGTAADEVDIVVISHAHMDHIGGLTTLDPGGTRVPVYARARHYFWRGEWEYWTSEENLATQSHEILAEGARMHLPPLREAGLVALVDAETEIAPDVRIIPAPGHTPGHVALLIGADQVGALYLGDAVITELGIEHPDWISMPDTLHGPPEATVATRRALLERAVAEQRVVIAAHMPPRGRVTRADGGYRLLPG